MSSSISRGVAVLTGLALATAAVTPAQAQFGGLLGSIARGKPSTSDPSSTTSEGCPSGKKKSAGAAAVGSIAGTVARNAAGRLNTFVPVAAFADILTSAIACVLDAEEQRQAADATAVATRGDAKTGDVKVGSTSTWTSQSRPDVTGRSTVTARNTADASGLDCIQVTDVVIVSGEETTANKRMCRPKGSKRYSLMA